MRPTRSISPLLLAALLLAATVAGARPAAAVAGLDARPANPGCRAPSRGPDPDAGAALVPALGGASLEDPTAAEQSPLDPAYWLVAERAGRVLRVDATDGSTTVALDLTGNTTLEGEGGMVGLALHPSFAANGYLFVFYTPDSSQPGTTIRARLSRFHSADGGASFDPASEQVLFDLYRETSLHLGGAVHFGPDGMLYVGLGDGYVSPTDAQDLGSLRGKLLRLDVDAGSPYAIPPDNPFVGVAGARGEIWARGFRNPYRWSFDSLTGLLWLGDVGELSWEEVDLVIRGGNYGWPLREGSSCYQGECATPGLIDPLYQYSHAEGCAIIGGFVYRGTSLPATWGRYVHGDLCATQLHTVSADGAGFVGALLAPAPEPFYGIAQGRDGELLVLGWSGAYQLVPAAGAPPTDPMPAQLSASGCVDPSDPKQPGPGLVPYDLIRPFWSDGAEKERWLALPDGARIPIGPDGDFALPPGSVTMKQFRIGGKLVETRFFVRHGDGTWGGYSYEWNDAETDATLLAAGKERHVGGQTWSYPSQAQCLQCHTAAAGYSLGLESAQQNRDLFYPASARTANQLETLSAIGMLESALPAPIGAQPRLETLTADQRARGWLHENCAGCHRPGGPTPVGIDLRATTPLAAMGVCDVAPALGDLGVAGARLLAPGDPARSMLSIRAHRVGAGQMPPLARSLVDVVEVANLDAWIQSIADCASGPDGDGDGVADAADDCPVHPDPGQADADGDGIGDACEVACRNGDDDDGDGLADYPLDPGCASALATSESPACDNGLDDDGDGLFDGQDVGCDGSSGATEQPVCANGLDDDGDGGVDWDGGGAGAADLQCHGRPTGVERSCGLGAELAPLLAALAALRGRRRARFS